MDGNKEGVVISRLLLCLKGEKTLHFIEKQYLCPNPLIMKKYILLLAIFLSLTAFAQTIDNTFALPDSLTSKLKEYRQNDESRANALIDIIEFCFDKQQFEISSPYIKELRNLKYYTEGDYYQTALCDYYYAMTIKNSRSNNADDLQEALQWADRSLDALENAIDNNETRRLYVRIKLMQSSCLFLLNMFSELYNCLEDGIEMAEIIQDSLLLGKLYNNLGLMYQNIYRPDESLYALRQSINYYPDNFPALLNLGITHNQYKLLDSANNKSNDSAYIYMDYALKAAPNKLDSAETYFHLGAIKGIDGSYSEAKKYLTLAMKGYDECNSTLSEHCLVRRDLALVEYKIGNLDRALELINEAIQLAEFGNQLKVLVASYSVRSLIEKQMGNYETALEDAEKMMNVHDELNRLHNENKLIQNEKNLILRKAQEQLRFEQFEAKQKQRTTWIVTGILAFFSLLTAILLVVINRKRRKMLELELDLQNREITAKTMAQMHINEVLDDVVEKLDDIGKKGDIGNDLNHVIKDLKSMVDDGSKKDFDYYFVHVHPDFYKKLSEDFPNLTQNDLRLCAFIKANMNTKEIAELNNMSTDSVKNSRSRLRKKLGIKDVNASLSDFISKY